MNTPTMRAEACVRACEGIADPETTIPTLVAALQALVDVLPANWGEGVHEGVLPAFHLLADDVEAALAVLAQVPKGDK